MDRLIRKTAQRKIILEELCKLTSHPTADELYFIVRDKLPRISLGTVYRNLEIMAQEGIVRKIEVGSKIKRFDGNTEKHFHLRCVKCDKIFDLMLDDYYNIDSLVHKMMSIMPEFKVEDYELLISGVCSNCQKNKNN